MASQSETLLSPSVIHPTRTVCLTQPEPATILIDDSDSEESIEENEPERAQINTRGRKRQREDEPQTRRKRLRTSMASEASSNSEEDVIDLTSDRDVIDVETAPSATRAPSTPMTTRNASYPPSHANPLNSLMRSFGMGQYHLPRIMLHHAYQPHPPAAAIDFLFSALPSSASLRSSSYGDYDYRPREPVENVEDRFGGGYWSRRRQQQLTRSSSSTGSSAQSGPVTVVDIDDDEPANRTSTSGTGSGASTRSPDKPNVTESTKPSAATVADLTKDLKCAICLGAIENITATVCGHIFCEGCILPAIEIQRKCPICRTPLTKKSIHPLFF